MAGKKKPKYGIGETVVVTIYGTVGTITDIKVMDGILYTKSTIVKVFF